MRGKAKKYLEYGKIGSNNRQNSNKKRHVFYIDKMYNSQRNCISDIVIPLCTQ